MRILVVEDDALVADAIRKGLAHAGFAVDDVDSAESARHALAIENFDLVVLDIGLPGADGLSLLKSLRSNGSTIAVLILTARDQLEDRVSALDLGADDYLFKPFEITELAARCRALIRRSSAKASSTLTVGRLELDLGRRTLLCAGKGIELPRREWAILECLALNLGRVVGKDKLQQAISNWDEAMTPNAVEVYVSRLRAKLGDNVTIRTVHGLGYRLEDID
jgi:DNA-binding response OmpR family regulator